MLINRIGDFAHSISPFYNNPIRYEFIHDFIVYIEGQTYLIRHNSDEQTLKTVILANISQQMPNVGAGSFSFTYLLYMRERFSAVGASCARDIARKP